jgi:hypothetical protein
LRKSPAFVDRLDRFAAAVRYCEYVHAGACTFPSRCRPLTPHRPARQHTTWQQGTLADSSDAGRQGGCAAIASTAHLGGGRRPQATRSALPPSPIHRGSPPAYALVGSLPWDVMSTLGRHCADAACLSRDTAAPKGAAHHATPASARAGGWVGGRGALRELDSRLVLIDAFRRCSVRC